MNEFNQRSLMPGDVIITTAGEIHGQDTPECRELARRVTACINACAGISTEELEAGVVHDMCRVLAEVAPVLKAKVRPDDRAA